MHRSNSRDRAIAIGLRVSLLVGASLCAHAGAAARVPFGAFLAADLDGDRQADFATAGALRRDGSGYLLDISVRLSRAESGAITVRTTRAAARISARDLDGDADRDLILESFDREPLAIVLNDGGGHFHQVSLDQYRAVTRRPESRSFETPAREADSPETGESCASPADTPALLASGPAEARAQRLQAGGERFTAPVFSIRASRAPPALL